MNTFNNWREFLDELPNDIADIIMDKVFEDQRPNIIDAVVTYFEVWDGFHYYGKRGGEIRKYSHNFFDNNSEDCYCHTLGIARMDAFWD